MYVASRTSLRRPTTPKKMGRWSGSPELCWRRFEIVSPNSQKTVASSLTSLRTRTIRKSTVSPSSHLLSWSYRGRRAHCRYRQNHSSRKLDMSSQAKWREWLRGLISTAQTEVRNPSSATKRITTKEYAPPRRSTVRGRMFSFEETTRSLAPRLAIS